MPPFFQLQKPSLEAYRDGNVVRKDESVRPRTERRFCTTERLFRRLYNQEFR